MTKNNFVILLKPGVGHPTIVTTGFLFIRVMSLSQFFKHQLIYVNINLGVVVAE